MVSNNADKIEVESGIKIDGYTFQTREKMVLIYGKKTTINAVYQHQKQNDSPPPFIVIR